MPQPQSHGAQRVPRSVGRLTPLSEGVLCRMLEWCDGASLLRFGGTCRTAYELADDPSLWKTLCLTDRVVGKECRFAFWGCWKWSYLKPSRSLGAGDVSTALKLRSSPPQGHGWYRRRRPRRTQWYAANIDVSTIPLRGDPIPRVPATIPLEEFFEKYDKGNTPVILTGAVQAWGWKGWTHQELVSRYADTYFKTNGTTEAGKTLRMTFKQYSDYCNLSWGIGEKPMYIFDNKFEQRAPDLLRDYSVPPLFAGRDMFDEMSAEDRPDYKWLLIGPVGSGAPFHTDPHKTHAWNVVTEGRKRVAMYPPYIVPPGVDKKLIHTEYYAACDTVEWYLDYYPKLRDDDLPVEAIVEPGELLFIPSGWWHQVLNISPMTIAITQNVCTAGNFPRVWKDLVKRGPKSLERRFKRDCLPKYAKLFQEYIEPPDESASEPDSSDDSSSESSSSDSSDSSSTS